MPSSTAGLGYPKRTPHSIEGGAYECKTIGVRAITYRLADLHQSPVGVTFCFPFKIRGIGVTSRTSTILPDHAGSFWEPGSRT